MELLGPGRTLRSTLGELPDCSPHWRACAQPRREGCSSSTPQALVRLVDDCSFAGVKPSHTVVSVRISLVTEDAECRSVSLWPFVSSLDNCPFKFFVPLKSLFRVRTLLKTADTAGVNVHKTGDVQGSLRSPRTRICLAPDRPWNWVVESFVRADQREKGTDSLRVSVLRASVCLSLPSGEEEESPDQSTLESLGARSPRLMGEGTAPQRGHGPAESRIRPLSLSTGSLLSLWSQLYRPGVQSRLHWNRTAI